MKNLTGHSLPDPCRASGKCGRGVECDSQKGLDAYYGGDYATALRERKPLAEQGNALAQSNLGVMYGLGHGVIQDDVCAHMWGNLAAANGDEDRGKLRDLVEKEMTPSQIAEAQDLARERP